MKIFAPLSPSSELNPWNQFVGATNYSIGWSWLSSCIQICRLSSTNLLSERSATGPESSGYFLEVCKDLQFLAAGLSG